MLILICTIFLMILSFSFGCFFASQTYKKYLKQSIRSSVKIHCSYDELFNKNFVEEMTCKIFDECMENWLESK